ncbi:unnamed protein product [Mytilus coruscus]|uniref:Uncharacterized protein n=1 Tax=Mytilus coruscus TaxID=42192 RepID=A0A6J8CVU6_MYTCO|nr:unnamed protein product [Mytilus coruscus]
MAEKGERCIFDDNCVSDNLFILRECKKETTNHVRFFKCGTDIPIPESLLILNRAGLGLRLSNFSKCICLKHRQEFGLQWTRRKRTCCHPLHDLSKSSRVAKGVNFIQSREIWVKFNLNVSVGSGICRRCIEKHKDEVQIATDLKGELREICCFLDNSTDKDEAGIVTVENLTEIATMNDKNQVAMCIDSEAINAESINTELVSDSIYEEGLELAMSVDSDPDMFSSQTTVASNWSKDERSQKDTFNWAMEMMSHGQYSPLKSQASLNIEDLQYSTKMYYKRQARLAFEIVCESIAPSQGVELMTQVYQSMKLKTIETKQKDAVTETIISAYKKAEDYTTKVQILSLIAEKYSKSELLTFIEGLTIYKIDAARKYASTHGPGQYVTPPKITRL